MSEPPDDALSSSTADLVRLLRTSATVPLSPQRVTEFMASAVPHSAHCGLTLVHANGRPETVAASTGLPERVDAMQYRIRQGPCLEAAATTAVVRIDDVDAEQRWPEFARCCLEETPVRSMFAVHLGLEGEDRAALNFYAESPHAFDDSDLDVASVLAPFATVALQSHVNRQHAEQLEIALASSRQIGIAIGILMARELVTAEQAFAQLRDASQHLNRKLRDIAATVTETGQLPQSRS